MARHWTRLVLPAELPQRRHGKAKLSYRCPRTLFAFTTARSKNLRQLLE